MKKYLIIVCLISLVSCDSKKEKNIIEEVAPRNEQTVEIDEDIDFEKALEEVAIKGNNLEIETNDAGQIEMSFDAETLKHMSNEIKKQLYEIENNVQYDSESVKQTAINSMKMNLELFSGEFCCITHNGKHCEDATQLQKLENAYNCSRFKKKS